MSLTDYTEVLDRLQKGLAARYDRDPAILNVPGVSVACRIDQQYFLVVEPLFTEGLAAWSGVFPSRVVEALTRSGNMLTGGPKRSHIVPVSVVWPGLSKPIGVRSAFVLADFIERALSIYGNTATEIALSDLKIAPTAMRTLAAFFKGKTPPAKWIFSKPEQQSSHGLTFNV